MYVRDCTNVCVCIHNQSNELDVYTQIQECREEKSTEREEREKRQSSKAVDFSHKALTRTTAASVTKITGDEANCACMHVRMCACAYECVQSVR